MLPVEARLGMTEPPVDSFIDARLKVESKIELRVDFANQAPQ